MSNRYTGTLFVVLFLLVFMAVTSTSPYNMLGQILLSESYKTCQSLDLNQDRVICEIYSEEDENNLVCLRLSNCKMPVTLCPDGSINKTCFPTRDDNSLNYLCICHSKRRAESIVPVTEWTTWTTSTNPYQSFKSERSLIVPSLDWVVLQEFSHFRPEKVYIISQYKLPTSTVYSASSYFSSGHEPYRASIDFVTNSIACSWAAKSNPAWLGMTLPTQYVVFGAFIKQRCDSCCLQYATRVKITRSVDGASWLTVIESEDLIYDSYDGRGATSVWFPQSYTERYWRIYLLNFHSHPSTKADLIGYK